MGCVGGRVTWIQLQVKRNRLEHRIPSDPVSSGRSAFNLTQTHESLAALLQRRGATWRGHSARWCTCSALNNHQGFSGVIRYMQRDQVFTESKPACILRMRSSLKDWRRHRCRVQIHSLSHNLAVYTKCQNEMCRASVYENRKTKALSATVFIYLFIFFALRWKTICPDHMWFVSRVLL